MTIWPRVVDVSTLGPIGRAISENNGESIGVYLLEKHPSWLLKVYRSGSTNPAEAARIDRLIGLLANAQVTDSLVLHTQASWPASRVTDGSRPLHGVLLPQAPKAFWHTFRAGTPHEKRTPLEIDWLASPRTKCQRQGIPFPSFADRLNICTQIVMVADFLERHDLVYGDWSYANAFWSPAERSGYVIDIDGCAPGRRQQLGTPNWEEPSPPPNRGADTVSDRYGVALLLARCLSAERVIADAMTALRRDAAANGYGQLANLVCTALNTTDRTARPAISDLLAAMRKAERPAARRQPPSGSNVIGWRNPSGAPARKQPARPAPAPAPKPAPTPTPTTRRPATAPSPSTGPTRPAPANRPTPANRPAPATRPAPVPTTTNGDLAAVLVIIAVIVVVIVIVALAVT